MSGIRQDISYAFRQLLKNRTFSVIAVLTLAWLVLPAEEGPPVIALAATMQWVSVMIGYFYHIVTGRELEATLRLRERRSVQLVV